MNHVKDVLGLQRRRYMRIPVDFKVHMDYVTKRGLMKQHFDMNALALNLSEGGIRISAPKIDVKSCRALLKKNVALDMEFALPFRKQGIETQGKIIWNRTKNPEEAQFGIQFVGISKENQDKIVMNIINQIVEWSLQADSNTPKAKKKK